MLERRRHAGQAHVAHVFQPEFRYDFRIGMKRALADDDIAASQIEYRCETEVDVDRTHLARHQPGMFAGEFQSKLRIARVNCTDARERRQARESVAKALHGTAFLIDADQQRFFAHRADIGN
jgi:hypothetical protein